MPSPGLDPFLVPVELRLHECVGWFDWSLVSQAQCEVVQGRSLNNLFLVLVQPGCPCRVLEVYPYQLDEGEQDSC